MTDYARIAKAVALGTVGLLALIALISVAWRSKKSYDAGHTLTAMVARAQAAHTLSFDAVVEGSGPAQRSRHVLLGTARHYQQIEGGETDVVQITDYRIPKTLLIFSVDRTASVVEIAGQRTGATPRNLMAVLRQMMEDEVAYTETETLGGAPAVRYGYDHGDDHYELWLSPETSLPMQIAMTARIDGIEYTTTMTNLAWDQEIDRALFSPRVPDGVEIASKVHVDLGDGDESGPEVRTFTAMRDFLCERDLPKRPGQLADDLGDMYLMTRRPTPGPGPGPDAAR